MPYQPRLKKPKTKDDTYKNKSTPTLRYYSHQLPYGTPVSTSHSNPTQYFSDSHTIYNQRRQFNTGFRPVIQKNKTSHLRHLSHLSHLSHQDEIKHHYKTPHKNSQITITFPQNSPFSNNSSKNFNSPSKSIKNFKIPSKSIKNLNLSAEKFKIPSKSIENIGQIIENFNNTAQSITNKTTQPVISKINHSPFNKTNSSFNEKTENKTNSSFNEKTENKTNSSLNEKTENKTMPLKGLYLSCWCGETFTDTISAYRHCKDDHRYRIFLLLHKTLSQLLSTDHSVKEKIIPSFNRLKSLESCLSVDDCNSDVNNDKLNSNNGGFIKEVIENSNLKSIGIKSNVISKSFDNIENNEILSNKSINKGIISNKSIKKGILSNKSTEKGIISNKSIKKGIISNKSIKKGIISTKSTEKGIKKYTPDSFSPEDGEVFLHDYKNQFRFVCLSKSHPDWQTNANLLLKLGWKWGRGSFGEMYPEKVLLRLPRELVELKTLKSGREVLSCGRGLYDDFSLDLRSNGMYSCPGCDICGNWNFIRSHLKTSGHLIGGAKCICGYLCIELDCLIQHFDKIDKNERHALYTGTLYSSSEFLVDKPYQDIITLNHPKFLIERLGVDKYFIRYK